MMSSGRQAFRWLFADRATGAIVVAQAPNFLLWVVIVMVGARLVAASGAFAMAAGVVERASLALWALDEIARGANPWRRFLGVAVLATMVGTALASRASQG